MAIKYEIHVDNPMLRVKTSGRDESLQEVLDYGLAIIQEALANQTRYVLCDERELRYAIGTLDIYESAKFIADQAPKIARVAIVCHPDCAADGAFWETVAVNRSLCVRVFLDIALAEKWLLEN